MWRAKSYTSGMRRVICAAFAFALVACATSQSDASRTHVRITTMPAASQVSLDCGKKHFEGAAPFEFDFPNGPYAHCIADIAAPGFEPLHVDIDRQFLFDYGEMKSVAVGSARPRVEPRVVGTGWDLIAFAIETGIEHALAAVNNATTAYEPDVTLRLALVPAGPKS